jgi:plastocyanin
MRRKRITWVVAGVTSLVLLAVPAVAQEDDTDAMVADPVEVTGVEYAFVGLPTSVPAGTEVTFRNDGTELHEIAIAHIPETTTESLEELLAMGDDALASGKVQMVGEGPLFAEPGGAAGGSLKLEAEGRYIALCFIPQGFDPAVLEAAGITEDDLGPDTDPSSLPAEVQAIMANPPHLAAGMLQEFTVTEAGSELGPLPQETTEEVEAA